jgi:hypothetical protein
MMALLAVFLMVGALVGSIGYGTVVLIRWARRTGRRPWLWLLGAYVAANILWAILRPYLEQP